VKFIGFYWGVGGVLLLLSFAIFRLTPMALELVGLPLSAWHYLALCFSIVLMAYSEGYKGFHLAFAPRVVMRAHYLAQNPRTSHVLLAPIFCMGFIHATRRRRLVSLSLSLMILGFIMTARLLPQPWRGILDAGVVTGLSLGNLSILYFLAMLKNNPKAINVATEVPEPG